MFHFESRMAQGKWGAKIEAAFSLPWKT